MSSRIFIVEDEMILNEQIKRFLEKNGYTVGVFPYAERCIEALENGTVPDLILMDINLGRERMDGPTATKKIYEKYDIPVVLHSAYTDKATLDTTRDMIKYGYIHKVPGNEQFVLVTVEMALKLHSTEKKLRKRENLYRELSNHLQNVREEQNAYLSREIHDDLGQSLTALKMNLTVIDQTIKSWPNSTDTVEKTLHDMGRILDGTVKKVRKISTELRPSVIDTEGIMEALQWQIDEFKKDFEIPVVFSREEGEIELGEKKSLQVFRIVQESLTNCVRHSEAAEISVDARSADGSLIITIEDNGLGFDTESADYTASFGLLGMRERAKQCGGTLHIDSIINRGTTVKLTIPIEN